MRVVLAVFSSCTHHFRNTVGRLCRMLLVAKCRIGINFDDFYIYVI